jgi:hypothetical protein
MPETHESAEERRLHAQIAANTRWSKIPRKQRAEVLQAARDAILAKHMAEIDPDGVLPEEERMSLARQARLAQLQSAALKSAAARRRSAASPQ